MTRLLPLGARAALATAHAVALLMYGAVSPAWAQSTQQVYLTVLDADDVPVPDLIADEIEVIENGVSREVRYLERSREQVDVTLVVDNTQAALITPVHMRNGLAAFIGSFGDSVRLSLVTMADFPRRVVGPASRADMQQAVARLFQEADATPWLRDALITTALDIRERRPAAPIVVVVASDLACGRPWGCQSERMVEILEALNAPVHMVVLRSGRVFGSGRLPGADATGTRGNSGIFGPVGVVVNPRPNLIGGRDSVSEGLVMLENITQKTGGRIVHAFGRAGLDRQLREIAREIQGRYTLTYLRPDLPSNTEPFDIRFRVARDDVTVRATIVR